MSRGGKIGWIGKTSDSKDTEQKPGPSYNELETARSLVGMKEAQPKSRSICNLRNREIAEKQESKDSGVTDVTEEPPASDAKVKWPGKLKLRRKPSGVKKVQVVNETVEDKTEENIELKTKETEGKTEQTAPKLQFSEKTKVDVSQMRMEVQALLSNDKAYADCENCRDTLKGILALLEQKSHTDICKSKPGKSDSDTGIIGATDKMDTSDTNVVKKENIVNYDVKLSVLSDTDDETSKIKNIVTCS